MRGAGAGKPRRPGPAHLRPAAGARPPAATARPADAAEGPASGRSGPAGFRPAGLRRAADLHRHRRHHRHTAHPAGRAGLLPALQVPLPGRRPPRHLPPFLTFNSPSKTADEHNQHVSFGILAAYRKGRIAKSASRTPCARLPPSGSALRKPRLPGGFC
ncbi:MAG: hypothetical protein CVU79_06975 [Elusimicrobia bacterium HGW-Elusimicrobia-3]|nr:MAG: hypothetical protein CVU79_06975 [Elusimicrobia bacterium HGW-Elusimicrobia-3]